MGDNAYFDGSRENFAECYDPSWGRHRERTRPAIGGHDYMTENGAPYFEYFGAAAGPDRNGYHSYELGSWTVVVLKVVMGGNDHSYERFAPQDPNGERDDATGPRQFVVGTGGGRLYEWGEVLPNSEFRYNEDGGVLKLTLDRASYDWQFIATRGSVIDSGSDQCHGRPE